MKHDNKNGLKPRIRFPEFEKYPEWKQQQLCHLAEPVASKAVNKDNDPVLTLSAERGLIIQGDYFGKKIAGGDVNRYTKIIRDDFVYNDRTTKLSTYGTIKRLSQYPSGIVSPIYKCFRLSEDENPTFWEWYFESGRHDTQLHSLINEGARAGRFNISIQQFLSTFAWRPEPSEQQKIADCLSSIDELIATQTQKLDDLKAHKKGLMQHLFPTAGETQPRLRFSGFAEKWKEKQLSSCIQLISGFHLPPNEYGITGEVPYFTGPSDFTNTALGFGKWTRNLLNTAIADDILITVKGSGVGDLWYLTLPRVAMGRQLMAIRAAGCCSRFIYQFLITKRDRFKALASGNLIPGLSRKDILDMTVLFPHPPEQQIIADCLDSLDEQVDIQTQKLSMFNDHKKGLLHQLFPSTEEVSK